MDPTNTNFDLQPPKILILMVISKKAQTMSGMTSSTSYHQDHFEDRRGVIVIAAFFTQDFIDLEYYIYFNCAPRLRRRAGTSSARVPGWFSVAPTWGQADFQEGRDVRSMLQLGRLYGLAPSTNTWVSHGNATSSEASKSTGAGGKEQYIRLGSCKGNGDFLLLLPYPLLNSLYLN
ncbi:hypothetical protein ZWY2020_051794 [Hordeum vulgare]|nr:hypothetical protein ZWY2020_051794 [Hordeum vulgare]